MLMLQLRSMPEMASRVSSMCIALQSKTLMLGYLEKSVPTYTTDGS